MARNSMPEIVLGGESMNGYALVIRVGESMKVEGLTVVPPSHRGSMDSLLRLENPICIGKIPEASFDADTKSIVATLRLELGGMLGEGIHEVGEGDKT